MPTQRTELEEVALQRLYQAKPGSPEHQKAEQSYNDQRRARLIVGGADPASIKYQRDVRHEFAFGTRTEADGREVQWARNADGAGGSRYPLRSPDEVINWRDTRVGAKIDQDVRSSVSSQTGDDAGHLIPLEYGADPADRRNLARQNFVQNQGGGDWHIKERELADQARQQPGRYGIEVEVVHNRQASRDRPIGRRWDVLEQDAQGREIPGTRDDKLRFFDSKSEEVKQREEGTFVPGTAQEARAKEREIWKENAAAVDESQQPAFRKDGEALRAAKGNPEERSKILEEIKQRRLVQSSSPPSPTKTTGRVK